VTPRWNCTARGDRPQPAGLDLGAAGLALLADDLAQTVATIVRHVDGLAVTDGGVLDGPLDHLEAAVASLRAAVARLGPQPPAGPTIHRPDDEAGR
jgi:hypothetical protein